MPDMLPLLLQLLLLLWRAVSMLSPI
jgi:hypothetical protein